MRHIIVHCAKPSSVLSVLIGSIPLKQNSIVIVTVPVPVVVKYFLIFILFVKEGHGSGKKYVFRANAVLRSAFMMK